MSANRSSETGKRIFRIGVISLGSKYRMISTNIIGIKITVTNICSMERKEITISFDAIILMSAGNVKGASVDVITTTTRTIGLFLYHVGDHWRYNTHGNPCQKQGGKGIIRRDEIKDKKIMTGRRASFIAVNITICPPYPFSIFQTDVRSIDK